MAATRMLEAAEPKPTAATQALPRRRAPQEVPARRPAPAAAPRGAGADQDRRRGLRRLAALVAVIALLGAGIAIAVAATSGGGGVQTRSVTARDAQSAVQQLQDLIDNNTK
jgi:hypothetical protein